MNQSLGGIPGSRASTEPQERLDPAGFDPGRALHILQHSLGVDKFGLGEQYRNHFVTGEGSTDYPDCMALTESGLMKRHGPSPLTGCDWGFTVTDAGRAYVAEHSPPAPKLTRGQRRYREWLNVSDATGETFLEYCRRRDASAIEARRAAATKIDAVADESAASEAGDAR